MRPAFVSSGALGVRAVDSTAIVVVVVDGAEKFSIG